MSRVASLALLACSIVGCSGPDPIAREQIVERDQLRREVAGFRSLEALAPGKLLDRKNQVLVSVTDTLLRSLIDAAFPVTVALPNNVSVTLTSAAVTFRANVARVDIKGEVRRSRFPQLAAAVTLRGALDDFAVDGTHALRTRISIDDVRLDKPSGAPAALDPLVINVLQRVVEGSLPELTNRLPAVAVPVRLDQAMQLPGFGPDGYLSVAPSRAAMSVEAARVIAFQNRLWIILNVKLGAFASIPAAAPVATTRPAQ